MRNLRQILLEEIPEFKAKGEAFLKGELGKMDFKKVSGGFGVYAHRDGKHFMIRLRILSGVLGKEQLVAICNLAERYAVPMIHLTTRQAIQFHKLSLDNVCKVMEEGLEYNLYTRGAGGNYPRNVAMSPLAGLMKEEAFDVVPYAMAANGYFLQRINTYHLPRKLKVSFTSDKEDGSQATVQDMGFVATLKDNKPYFKLYLGGGLGRNPRKGIPVDRLLPAEEALYALEAMVQLFTHEGDYEHHHKARVRYIADRMGDEAFVNCFWKYFEAAKVKGGLDFSPEMPKYTKVGKRVEINHIAITSQKQEGLYSYYFHPLGGQLDYRLLRKISNLIEPMTDVHVRLSMGEGLYLVHLNGEEVQQVAEALDADNYLLGVEQTRSCIGVPICQMGILESQKALRAIVDYFKAKGNIKESLPPIYISGCPNSCGVHQIAGIGLVGNKKKIDGVLTGIYDVYMKGKCTVGETHLGELIGEVQEDQLPAFLYDLASKIEAAHQSFDQYMEANKEEVEQLLSK